MLVKKKAKITIQKHESQCTDLGISSLFEFFKAKSKKIYIHGILIFFHTCKFEKSVGIFFITCCVQHPVYSKGKIPQKMGYYYCGSS